MSRPTQHDTDDERAGRNTESLERIATILDGNGEEPTMLDVLGYINTNLARIASALERACGT